MKTNTAYTNNKSKGISTTANEAYSSALLHYESSRARKYTDNPTTCAMILLDRRKYLGASTGIGGSPANSALRELCGTPPPELQIKEIHCSCAECRAILSALEDGCTNEELAGAICVAVGNEKRAGRVSLKPPCPSCKRLLARFGIVDGFQYVTSFKLQPLPPAQSAEETQPRSDFGEKLNIH